MIYIIYLSDISVTRTFASQGEEIVIASRGKEWARLVSVPLRPRRSLEEILDSLAEVRMKLPKGMTVKDLIEGGRRS